MFRLQFLVSVLILRVISVQLSIMLSCIKEWLQYCTIETSFFCHMATWLAQNNAFHLLSLVLTENVKDDPKKPTCDLMITDDSCGTKSFFFFFFHEKNAWHKK